MTIVVQSGVLRSAGGGGAATLDPSNTSGVITLSGGNLTATSSTATTHGDSSRSYRSHSTGKYYHEFTFVSSPGGGYKIAIGGCTAAFDVSDAEANDTQNSFAFYNGDGSVYINSAASASIGINYVVADILGVAIDLDNKKLWMRKGAAGQWNGDNLTAQNPETNAGGVNLATLGGGLNAGPYYVFVYTYYTSGTASAATVNFGGSTYDGTPPTGFGNW